MKPEESAKWKRYALHGLRVALFVAILGLIHTQHVRREAIRAREPLPPIGIDKVASLFPAAESIAAEARADGGREVFDASGNVLGFVLQTAPESDHLIGFSGSTNVLIGFSPDSKIVGLEILDSGDTREHVAQVREDKSFMTAFNGLDWEQAAANTELDAVTGATLTSRTIQEAVIHRLSGQRPSLRFPDPLVVADAKALFSEAASVGQDPAHGPLWHVFDSTGEELGSILRTTPAADNVIGFQGPTEARIGFDPGGRVIGIGIGTSYDNEPYVTYVREEEYFLTLFNDLVLDELATLDLEQHGVEGVSGATMTSRAVAEGMLIAAQQYRESKATAPRPPRAVWQWTIRDLGTALVVLAGLVVALTPLRGNKLARIGLQVVLIVYLGFINGDMLSQAMLVGWAKSGVPWTTAGGLVVLTCAALVVPVTTGRNAYCTHLCPHGAAQQLLRNRLPWKARLPRKASRWLKLIPLALLAWCIVVPMAALPFSLVDIEPFDAWVFRVAGWATISIAVVGLVASLFLPMAYCRYGCPTGALLGFLRFHGSSDRWSRRDWCAAALLAIAVGLWLIG